MNNIQFDIVIVGGGIVGISLACSLASKSQSLNKPLSIAVIESRAPEFDKIKPNNFDIRVSAITRASQRVFDDIGAWSAIAAKRVCAFTDMHVWDDTGVGEIHFDSADIGEASLGNIIENSVILSSLYERLSDFENVSLICPAKIEDIHYFDDCVELVLHDNTVLNCKLVIAADGSQSWVRQQANILVRGWDYPQDALVTWVKTQHAHQHTAWQRFMPDGPLAFLPLQNGYSSIVWSSSPEHVQQLLNYSDVEFCSALTNAFSNKLGQVLTNGPRARFPLRYFVTEHYIKPRLALIGDAAHTMHPLAGQGVNVGIQDVIALSAMLFDAHLQQKDLGAIALLRRYERSRRAENSPMLSAVNGFQRLFSSTDPNLTWARNLGMKFTDSIPVLKNQIMRQAMD
ncbi:2-polyprenylphenol hydroxylase [hydrothermal vent metagenome]|uniref:2-polyprenylphenol hydroxylase n=1 Tax=hydrothermal vent metagenome TaxID=652676 RepID=A0A3B1ACQ1_9ZZZZ